MNEDLVPAKKGLWIPIEILFDERLSPTEKLLFSEIDWLDNPDFGGCFASNDRFARLLGIKVRQVQQCLSNLKKCNLIKQSSFNGRQRILNSNMKYCFRDAVNCTSAIQENAPLLHIREKTEEKQLNFSSPQEKIDSKPNLSKYHYLSELLITKIKENGTGMLLKPERDIPRWANDFRLMVEQDKRTEAQIEREIEIIFADNFWSKQIRSASKMRKQWAEGKFDRLMVQDSEEVEVEVSKKPKTPFEAFMGDTSMSPSTKVQNFLFGEWEKVFGNKDWKLYNWPEENNWYIEAWNIVYTHTDKRWALLKITHDLTKVANETY